MVLHEAFANSASGLLGWSQQGSWLAVLTRPILSVTSVVSKAAGRIRFADVQQRERSGVSPLSRSSGRVFQFLLYFDSHALGIPLGFVFQHTPGNHRDLPSHSDCRLLLACLLATVNAIVGGASPRIVLQTDPGTFQQHRP